MVVIRMPDGSNQDYHLRRTSQGLRLVRPCASYELVVMMAGAGWEIAGVRTQAAKRLLKAAGLFSADLPLLPRRTRWHIARRYADSTG
jgi:hypothetical protein